MSPTPDPKFLKKLQGSGKIQQRDSVQVMRSHVDDTLCVCVCVCVCVFTKKKLYSSICCSPRSEN